MKQGNKTAILLAGLFFIGITALNAQELDKRLFKPSSAINPEASIQSLDHIHKNADSDRTIFCVCHIGKESLPCPSYNKTSGVIWTSIISDTMLPAHFSKEELLFLKADMHLMIPVTNLKIDLWCGHWEHPQHENPPDELQGQLARALFYASIQYHIPLPHELEDRLRVWHLMHPPTKWEERLNSLIEEKQGNRNPFIDHPALVERVSQFR